MKSVQFIGLLYICSLHTVYIQCRSSIQTLTLSTGPSLMIDMYADKISLLRYLQSLWYALWCHGEVYLHLFCSFMGVMRKNKKKKKTENAIIQCPCH